MFICECVCVCVCECVYVCVKEREKKQESFIYSDSPLTRCKARTELLNDVHQILNRGF